MLEFPSNWVLSDTIRPSSPTDSLPNCVYKTYRALRSFPWARFDRLAEQHAVRALARL